MKQVTPHGLKSRAGLEEMTPGEIVSTLDRHVVGQSKAKRALAVALRNRARRRRLDDGPAREIQPRNVILIGPTGVGKTELARRLAQLSRAPFIKVEASKFTEVGYVGRDVESIIDELAENAVQLARRERLAEVEKRAQENAEERLLDLLLQSLRARKSRKKGLKGVPKRKAFKKLRKKLRRQLRAGKLDKRRVELEVPQRFLASESLANVQLDEFEVNLVDLLNGLSGPPQTQKLPVEEAISYLIMEEESKLVDEDQIVREALEQVQENGIVFVDELDKIAGRESGGQGPQVSREGVQRNLLPIVDGTTVHTRYGSVQTDHILFVAAGAFHVSRPSDLIPELQGRFPVRVEMNSLSEQDLTQILVQPEGSLVRQYQALLRSDGIDLEFTTGALSRIAHFAAAVNRATENIGARRLHTLMESLLEEVSFAAPDLKEKRILIDEAYVDARLRDKVKDQDLSRYML